MMRLAELVLTSTLSLPHPATDAVPLDGIAAALFAELAAADEALAALRADRGVPGWQVGLIAAGAVVLGAAIGGGVVLLADLFGGGR